MVFGEASRQRSRIYYPLNPGRKTDLGALFWDDLPERPLGPHNGKPDSSRGGL
jgi:hypothetical protein